MMFQFCVYIMVSKCNGMFYIGVISDIIMCVWMYKKGCGLKFCVKYGVNMLVWLEFYEIMDIVILCEKCIKEWKCVWKFEFIEG